VAAHAFAVHAHEVWQRFLTRGKIRARPGPSLLWTTVATGIGVVSVVTTPLGTRIWTGKSPDLSQSVSAQTPMGAAAWLREHPPSGQVFNIYEWGDYLVWAGRPDLPVFVTSQAHLVPPAVWRDYLAVIRLTPGWEEILDKYAVSTVVLDKVRRGSLIGKLRKNGAWKVVFADDVAVIFARK